MKLYLSPQDKSFLSNMIVGVVENNPGIVSMRVVKALSRRLNSNKLWDKYKPEHVLFMAQILHSVLKLREQDNERFESLNEEEQKLEETINSYLLVLLGKFNHKLMQSDGIEVEDVVPTSQESEIAERETTRTTSQDLEIAESPSADDLSSEIAESTES